MYKPLHIILGFNLTTFAIYMSGLVIQYPENNTLELSYFIFMINTTMVAGYLLGIKIKVSPSHRVKWLNNFPKIGFLASVLIFVPTVHAYTGNSLSSILNLILNPSDAYLVMVNTVTDNRDERLWLILIKTLISPFVICALPYYAYLFFSEKKHKLRFFLLATLMLLTSVFRGTDKEIFDVFIISFSMFLVAHHQVTHKKTIMKKILSKKNIYILLSVFLLLAVFSYRKGDRLEGIDYFCFKGTAICHSLSLFGNDNPGTLSTGVVMITRYLTQGYHGLASAFGGSFESGWGFGHSRPLQFLSQKLLPISFDNNLINQLDNLGWSSKGLWSSAYVWMGNDVPLHTTPIVIFFMSIIFAYSWKESISTDSILAKVIFSIFFFTFIYAPANLQIAQSGDLYIGFLVILALYIYKIFYNNFRYQNE